MKKYYILRKKVFAIIFFVFLFSFAGVNAFGQRKEVLEAVKEQLAGIKKGQAPDVSEIEEEMSEELVGKMYFIETYGCLAEVLGKKEFNNFSYLKDDSGMLQYASFYREETEDWAEYAMRVRRLQDAVSGKGTKVLMVIAPSKYIAGTTEFGPGMPANDPSDRMDEFLYYVNQYGVEILDLRKAFPNEQLTYQETFYKTDHHWTLRAAFSQRECW